MPSSDPAGLQVVTQFTTVGSKTKNCLTIPNTVLELTMLGKTGLLVKVLI